MRPRRASGSEELDLVPIMNLVTILIPFLLMSAQFVTLGAIDSVLPALSDTDPDPQPTEALELSVAISGTGFAVAAKGDLGLEPGAERIPCTGDCLSLDAWDAEALTDVLADVKDRYPDEEAVILVPGSGIPYEVLILTMDAARRDASGRELFPAVVVAGGAG